MSHLLLALAVVAVWGTNFVVIHVGLQHFEPLTFAALRFVLAAFPAIFFLPRPAAPMRVVALYGVLIGVGQFGLVYIAMDGLITPGLASLVLQAQVFFTILIAAGLSGERVTGLQSLALVLCAVGLLLIAFGMGGTASLPGLALVIGAAVSWAVANTVIRSTSGERMLSFVVWGSLFSVPPLLALAMLVDGPANVLTMIGTADATAWAALAWQSIGNTLFGYAAWTWLLARHPAALITPSALLVPIFGMSASALLVGEAMPAWKVGAAAIIIAGLALNFSAPWLRVAFGRA